MKSILILFSTLFLFSFPFIGFTQTADSLSILDYGEPVDYEIGGVEVVGANFSDDNAIISIAGFKVGDKIRIPGGDIPMAIKSLWKLRLFTDVQILKTKTIGDVVFLEIRVEERPRLSKHSFEGAKKARHDDLNTEVNKFLLKGGIVTENVKTNAAEAIRGYYVEKGYLDTEVKVREVADSSRVNSVRLVFNIDRNERIKIEDITFSGNTEVRDKKLRKLLDNTKRKRRLFASSKLIRDDYEMDKKAIVAYYNTIGFRDAKILRDSMWRNEDGDLLVNIDVEEGQRYFFRDISWKGNSIYDEKTLREVLGIEKGEVYNQELLETRLRFSQEGRDVSTLYMDNGYLFFTVDPIETAIIEDSIDLQIRIFEGPQATIDKVTIAGNDRTHEHVVRRELRTRPGEKFSRSDIIRSQREIINLGYFNPENLGINTPVNPERGTVDIEYTVEEKPSDQLELSAGWGGNRRVIGTLGVSFNNFSLRNIFKKETWSPLPQGDGQRLSIRAQTNGSFYQSYNLSFTEPWLGGKKPTSFTVAGFYNRFAFGVPGTSSAQSFNIYQGSVSLGTRLKFPDDNFISSTALNLQTLNLNNWTQGLFRTEDGGVVADGTYYNFSIKQTIARNSISDPIFPRSGSRISLDLQITLPYSLFRDVPIDATPQERFRYLEYHKWRFNAEWYTAIVGKLTLKAAAKIGILGRYSERVGTSPFERFQLGGDGINNQQFGFAGVDIISLRGYEIEDLEANLNPTGTGNIATPLFDKFTLELRYPLSLNPSSTIYLLTFVEGGNSWRNIRDFNPFELKRSAGFGLRVFLPMFGVLGFDYGIGFDKAGERSLSNMGNFNIILGFEPE
ncbi:MAG: outer membrane protein assembly factor BamA [Saprospiraceae bacterium]